MKVQILQENLNKGLITASRIISSKAQLPILANVLLKTDNGRLQISATNLENGISLWIGSKVEKEGEITIPARVLSEVVSSLPAGKVDFEVTDNSSLTLSSGGYNARFNGISSSEFPKLPTYLPENLISLPASEHSRLPRRLRSCARTRIVREITDGCNVGSYIAIARTSQNVSLCALAKKAGVSPGHLSLIETGQRIPLITTFISIALALQLSLDDLAYGFLSDDISPKLTIVDRS